MWTMTSKRLIVSNKTLPKVENQLVSIIEWKNWDYISSSDGSNDSSSDSITINNDSSSACWVIGNDDSDDVTDGDIFRHMKYK